MSSDPMMISTFKVIIAASDRLDDELGDGKEALEGDAEILGAEHAVTAGREESGQRVIVRLRIWIKNFLLYVRHPATFASLTRFFRSQSLSFCWLLFRIPFATVKCWKIDENKSNLIIS